MKSKIRMIAVQSSDGDEKSSIADLGFALTIIFMFIAIAFMIKVSEEKDELKKQREAIAKERDRMEQIASAWAGTRALIYEELTTVFKEDLPRWNATIEEDLTVSFNEPRVLFPIGQTKVTPKFEEILTSFFPRYIEILHDHKASIAEVRIEGHTSSEWNEKTAPEQAYFLNMGLSQGRTRAVLRYALSQVDDNSRRAWARWAVSAAGMSSSRPVWVDGKAGMEDADASRRVEFRILTRDEEKLAEILDGYAHTSAPDQIPAAPVKSS